MPHFLPCLEPCLGPRFGSCLLPCPERVPPACWPHWRRSGEFRRLDHRAPDQPQPGGDHHWDRQQLTHSQDVLEEGQHLGIGIADHFDQDTQDQAIASAMNTPMTRAWPAQLLHLRPHRRTQSTPGEREQEKAFAERLHIELAGWRVMAVGWSLAQGNNNRLDTWPSIYRSAYELVAEHHAPGHVGDAAPQLAIDEVGQPAKKQAYRRT